jgi:hypothetical protein
MSDALDADRDAFNNVTSAIEDFFARLAYTSGDASALGSAVSTNSIDVQSSLDVQLSGECVN